MKSRKEKSYTEEIEEITPGVMSEEEVVEEPVIEDSNITRFRAKENINIRTEPTVNSTVAGRVNYMQLFEVTEIVATGRNRWGKLVDGTGWVCIDYAKEED